jgi:hypothetical protein
VPPTGKKSSAYLYPSGQVPGGYRVSVPELPYLIGGVGLGNGGDALATGDDGDAGDDDVLSAMRHVGIGIVVEVRDVAPSEVRLLEDNAGASMIAEDDGGMYCARHGN